MAIIYAGVNGLLDDIGVDKIQSFGIALRSFLDSNHPELLVGIQNEQELTKEIEDSLRVAIEECKQSVPY